MFAVKEERLGDLADSDGAMVLDPGHPDDVALRVLQALRIMLGNEAAGERRRLEKEIADVEELRDDVQAFANWIDAIRARGYAPHIDDGVLINMAPLWELIPSWQAVPKNCWQALERDDYDWAYMAMDYWPDRVKEKCKENKSYAIAHDLAE